MCGIAGLIDRRGLPETSARTLIGAMSARIARRGPDGTDVWGDGAAGAWFVHRRLSIIDLSDAGTQPIISDDGRVVLTYNGELYNTAEIRAELAARGRNFRGHSDSEVVANGLAEWGAEALLPKLLGMFAFSAWWRDRRELVLVRDRLGKKPLYWTRRAGGVAFASELPALTALPDVSRDIDQEAAASYLRTGHVPEPRSILAAVAKLPAGGLLRLRAGSDEPELSQWWTLSESVRRAARDPFIGNHETALAEAGPMLDDAVSRRMVSDVPFGAFLSGGIDSSLVVARMQAVSGSRVSTFSIGYHEAAYDESSEAEAVARQLGSDHHSFILEPADVIETVQRLPAIYGEPFADPSAVPSTILAERARKHVTMVLTGDGGDETFAGYNRYAAARGLLAKFDHLPRVLRGAMAKALAVPSPAAWDRIFALAPAAVRPRSAGEKVHKFAALLPLGETARYRQVTSQWPDVAAIRQGSEASDSAAAEAMALLNDPVARLRYLDFMTYLPGDILTKVDRATMAHGLEARAPLLDHRLVEWSFRLPTGLLMHDRQPKWLLRSLLARDLPRDLWERPKSGFGIPISDWLRGPMRDWAEDLLDPVALDETGLVHTKAVRQIWQDHLAGRVNAQYGLWTVLMLQAWRHSFVAPPSAAGTTS